MDHFVHLDRLPEGLRIPPDLTEQVQLDPESRRLSFRGFMSKADYDRLSLLSEDWSYRRRLEELFQQCTLVEERPHRLVPSLCVGVLTVGLLAGAAFWYWSRPMGPGETAQRASQAAIPRAAP